MIPYLLVFLTIFSPIVFGEEVSHFIDSTRALGRGGTSIAAFDSDEAVSFNSATLAEPSIRFQLRLLQFDGFVSGNTIGTLSDIISLASTGSFVTFLKKLGTSFSKTQYVKIQVKPLAQRYGAVEVSPFVTNSTHLEMRVRAFPMLSIENDTVFGSNIAYGRALFKDFNVGLNVRPFYQMTLPSSIDFSTLVDSLSPNASLTSMFPLYKGFYLGIDPGMLWQLSPSFRWGVTIRDLFDTSALTGDTTHLPIYKRQISTGVLQRFDLGHSFNLDLFCDYNDILNDQEVSLLRRINVGTEVGMKYLSRDNDLGITFGANEGYFSFGTFLDLFLFRLDIANYAVEMGEYPGQRRDRRWSGSIRSTMTF